ncbi:hypothetical protein MKW98_025095 [Papaver atlanticum]|uniref:Uncharacterized protein n=1 Tax=Papaver atlanticum TaxID=357466 RepID=A0AAD4S310_9MAGN|nr:hypothetical protein MKW98_025095 [Papaver atlanticum]
MNRTRRSVYEAHRCAVLQPKQRNAVLAAAQECACPGHQLTSRPLIPSPLHPINMKATFHVLKSSALLSIYGVANIFQPLNPLFQMMGT